MRLEKRDGAAADALPDIVGVAAVYYDAADPVGTQYHLWDNNFERIMPGAFDVAVTRDDVRALQNHDPRLLLGRSVANTLALELSPGGLGYRITTPNTTAGRDTIESLSRGDLTGSSFAFAVDTGGVNWTEETVSVNGVDVSIYVRNITAIVLFDVGPVTYPAYTGTSSGTRSPGIFVSDSRSGLDAETTGVRAELADFVKRTKHEPAAASRLRRCRLAELGGAN